MRWRREGREGGDIAIILHMLDVHNTWIIQIYSLTKRMFAENNCVWVSVVISCLIQHLEAGYPFLCCFILRACLEGGGGGAATALACVRVHSRVSTLLVLLVSLAFI